MEGVVRMEDRWNEDDDDDDDICHYNFKKKPPGERIG